MKIDFSASINDQFLWDALGIGKYPLDSTVKWIQDNLAPEEVFEESVLKSWAKNNGFEEVDGE